MISQLTNKLTGVVLLIGHRLLTKKPGKSRSKMSRCPVSARGETAD